ncbi:AAT family amino acid transporter [Phyllosticta citriasiana]|uniref:AAT family amino acid transporter n=1 Tax=Phyllosticta citriasiana TaxID=595635 RepID=UPI0030FD794C
MAEDSDYEKASATKADSVKEGEIFDQLKRNFKPRHMAMISLGGLQLCYLSESGVSLVSSSDGSMVLALRVLLEASILFSISGSFIDHASRFVDPAFGFACGECRGLWILSLACLDRVSSQGAILSIVVSYWTDDIPTPALMTIYLLVVFFIHAMPNTWFGEFEFVVSNLNVGTLLPVSLALIAFLAGAGPTGTTQHYQNFTELDAFPNGYKGIVQSMILAAWAIAGLELIGITNGEASSPRVSLHRAQGLLMGRIIVLLAPAFAFVLMLVPYTSSSLLGTSNAASSPFVTSINAIIILSLFTIGAEALYLSYRIATAMARMRILATGAGIGLVLAYINCSSGGALMFTWFSSLTSIVFLTDPIVVGITNLRMRRALALQGDDSLQGRYAYTVRWLPLEPILLILSMSFCLVSALYLAVDPIDPAADKGQSFFELFLAAPIFVVAFVGYRLVFRSKIVDLNEADWVSGCRPVSEAGSVALDAYNALPLWRRVVSYLRM